MIEAAIVELEKTTASSTACRLLGKSRATLYRQRHPRPHRERSGGGGRQPTALSDDERTAALATLSDLRFVDKSPAQVWAILLDEGVYLASVSTMYRLLRACQVFCVSEDGPFEVRAASSG